MLKYPAIEESYEDLLYDNFRINNVRKSNELINFIYDNNNKIKPDPNHVKLATRKPNAPYTLHKPVIKSNMVPLVY